MSVSLTNKKTILLVEDEIVNSMFAIKILQRLGFIVLSAMNGNEAIEICQKSQNIFLILMDIDLGSGIDGIETAEKILQNQDIPVVFLSCHSEPEIVEKTERITSYGYVVKGSGATILHNAIKMAFKLFDAKLKYLDELSRHKNTEEKLHFNQMELIEQNEELRANQANIKSLQAKYYSLYDLAPVSYLAMSEQGTIFEANLTSAKMLGTVTSQLEGNPLAVFILAEDQDMFYLHCKKIFSSGIPHSFELSMIRKDGTVFLAHFAVTAITEKEQKPISYIVIMPLVCYS